MSRTHENILNQQIAEIDSSIASRERLSHRLRRIGVPLVAVGGISGLLMTAANYLNPANFQSEDFAAPALVIAGGVTSYVFSFLADLDSFRLEIRKDKLLKAEIERLNLEIFEHELAIEAFDARIESLEHYGEPIEGEYVVINNEPSIPPERKLLN